jgi:integrase
LQQPKLLDRVRAVARLRHLSLRAEQAYSDWIRRFILYQRKRHPEEMGVEEVRQFLSHLAVKGKVAASTQNVALCALLFLYRDVLQVELPSVGAILRAKRPARVPVVFTRQEVSSPISRLSGTYGLIAGLLYGSGPRLLEAGRLRAEDLDFEYMETLVRDGKGEKDRRTILPRPLSEPLRHQPQRVKLLHGDDLREGFGEVYLPYALARKYPSAAVSSPGAPTSFNEVNEDCVKIS